MPLYEYRCNGCGRTFEVIQKFSDPDLSLCSECGGELEKLLSAPAIRFKGSGWYVNDYAGKSSSNGHRSEAPSSEPAKKADSSEKKESDSSKDTSPKVA